MSSALAHVRHSTHITRSSKSITVCSRLHTKGITRPTKPTPYEVEFIELSTVLYKSWKVAQSRPTQGLVRIWIKQVDFQIVGHGSSEKVLHHPYTASCFRWASCLYSSFSIKRVLGKQEDYAKGYESLTAVLLAATQPTFGERPKPKCLKTTRTLIQVHNRGMRWRTLDQYMVMC